MEMGGNGKIKKQLATKKDFIHKMRFCKMEKNIKSIGR